MICTKCTKSIPDDALFCCYCGKSLTKKPTKAHQRPNGTGTAYKRGSTWVAAIVTDMYYDENGKLKRHQMTKGGFKTKTQALEHCLVMKKQHTEKITQQEQQKKIAPTLQHYWEMYESAHLPALSKDKRKAYTIAWHRMKPLYGKPVDIITVNDLLNIVSSTTSTYYPARDMKVVLTHIFKMAAADGHANKDLPSFIPLPKLQEAERQPFTQDEQTALWNQYESGNADATIPLLMIYTGMMPGEMMRLTVRMIDLEAQQIRGVGLKTKVRKESSVYIPTAILPLVEQAIESAIRDDKENPDPKIFRNTQDTFYKRYYDVLEKAGCRRLTPYSCRHTTATALAITQNIAPQTVRKIMRWSTTAMLKRYAHPDETAIFDAINTLTRTET